MLTRHNVTTALLVVLIIFALASVTSALLLPTTDRAYGVIVGGAGTLIFAGLLAAHLRHWRWTNHLILLMITVLAIFALEPAYVSDTVMPVMFLPVVVAALLSTPLITLLVSAFMLLSILARVYLQYGYITPDLLGPTFLWQNLFSTIITALGITLISATSKHAERIAQAKAAEAEETLRRIEQQANELAEQNQQLEQRSGEQQRLLELVATLETPALALAEGVLFAPVVGHVDSQRAQRLTDRLLDDAHSRRAKVVVLDVSGIAVMDTGVARALLQTARALKLLGCQVILSGISATVAITLTQLGIELAGVQTTRTPQEALQQAVRLQGSEAATPTAPRSSRNGH